MSANNKTTKNHGKSGAATVAPSMNPQGGAAETSSATDRAGDVPAAVLFKAKRKNIARRKERRKEREAAKRNATYWAKRNVPRELRAWLDF